tara:strand:+ start:3153 stop:4220 length:1068 start_codon:yes stop_codon:yes gene_type:complete
MVLRRILRVLGSDPRAARNLTREEAFQAFTSILGGGESEVTVGSFLTALRWKGVTEPELMGFALAARSQARIPCRDVPDLVTVCPPHDGQDTAPPLDVASGLIAAAAGARVLLVSDRSVPPKRGLTAASVLEPLGLSMTWDPSEAEDWVTKGRFAAVSVTGLLPALLPLRRVRGDVVMRTPLSTVEKLLAPPGASVVIGAMSGPVLGTAAEVLQGLGHPRSIALQGVDGGVIPFVTKRTRGIEISREHLVPLTIEPPDFGLDCDVEPELPMFGPPEEGFGAADNPGLVKASSDATQAILNGELGPARNAALLGAAVFLKASGKAPTIADGISAATEALESGAARERIEHLKSLIR